MRRNHYDEKQKMRTFGFVTGAVLLLAVLTVVLCAMGGIFNFTSGSGGTDEATAPPLEVSGQVQTTPLASVPSPTPTAEPTPTPAETWTISAIAGKGGDLEPSGLVKVDDGGSVTFSVVPEDGYVLDELRVDGESVSVSDTYTFTDVGENHAIYAVFRLLPQKIPAAAETPPTTYAPSSPTDIG
jgi:hypothetical protein